RTPSASGPAAGKTPTAAASRSARRRRQYEDRPIVPATAPQADRTPACSSTPPPRRTLRDPKTRRSVTATLHRGVISILRLHQNRANCTLWKNHAGQELR